MRFKLFSNCVPVKGASRSILYDLQRGRYDFIPNILAEILTAFDGRAISEVKAAYGNRHDAIIEDYFRFLEEQEYIFETEEPELFPHIDRQFETPCEITNAILEIGAHSTIDYAAVFDQLDALTCQVVEIRFFFKADAGRISEVLAATQSGKLRSVELLLEYAEKLSPDDIKTIVGANPRISRISIFSAPANEVTYADRFEQVPVLYTSSALRHESAVHPVNPAYFVCSLNYFLEAITFNTYFHRKVAITSGGEIRNYPAGKLFGNVSRDGLQEIVGREEFRTLWYARKDEIHVCRDCEFRYMCTDSREPVKNEQGEYMHASACSYDPYTMRWENPAG
jgi:SPASM domain peptide maturase of grasp-with-spasm system